MVADNRSAVKNRLSWTSIRWLSTSTFVLSKSLWNVIFEYHDHVLSCCWECAESSSPSPILLMNVNFELTGSTVLLVILAFLFEQFPCVLDIWLGKKRLIDQSTRREWYKSFKLPKYRPAYYLRSGIVLQLYKRLAVVTIFRSNASNSKMMSRLANKSSIYASFIIDWIQAFPPFSWPINLFVGFVSMVVLCCTDHFVPLCHPFEFLTV